MTSKTPRTDALELDMVEDHEWPDARNDLCRQLETELADTQAKLAKLLKESDREKRLMEASRKLEDLLLSNHYTGKEITDLSNALAEYD